MIEKNELMADDFVLVRAEEEKPVTKTNDNPFDVSKTFTTVKAKNKETGENETFLVTSERDIEIQMEIGVRDEGTSGDENFVFMKNDFTAGEEKIYSRCPDNFLNFLNQYFLKYNRYPNINTNINYYTGTTTEGVTTYDLKKSIQGPLTAVYKTSEFPFEQINEYMEKALLDSKGGETSIPMTNQHYYIQDNPTTSYCDCLITKSKMAGQIRDESPISFDGQLVIIIPDGLVRDSKTLQEGDVGKEDFEVATGHFNIVQVSVDSDTAKLVSINYKEGKIHFDTTGSKVGDVIYLNYGYMNVTEPETEYKVKVKDAYPCRYTETVGTKTKNRTYEWGVLPTGYVEDGMSYSEWLASGNCFGEITFVMQAQKEDPEAPMYLDRLYFVGLPKNGFEKLGIDLVTFTGATEDTEDYLYALEGFMEENFDRKLQGGTETEENARFKIIIQIITEQTEPKLQMKMETSRFKRAAGYQYDESAGTATLTTTTLSEIREAEVSSIDETDMYLDHNLHLPEIYRETEDEIPFSLKPADYHTI